VRQAFVDDWAATLPMKGVKLELTHMVRRYASVGGMKRYVWELTQELVHHATVVCERCHLNVRYIMVGLEDGFDMLLR